jgi:hypothetical protein
MVPVRRVAEVPRPRQIGDMVSSTPRITVVPSPACHFCDDADRTLAELSATFAYDVERVPLETAEGQRLVALHRPPLAPLVLVDGEYFSAGRLPRKKLVQLLTARGARLEAVAADGR